MIKLLENIIIEENGYFKTIPAGTIIREGVFDLDAPEAEPEEAGQDEMIRVVQQWIETNRPRFTPEGWSKVNTILQPAIDAIYDRNIEKLKSHAIAMANKVDSLESNPKAKNALEKIHDLYIKLLGMARGHFGESIDTVVKIVKESLNKLKTIL